MNYKYNITYKEKEKSKVTNFKTKQAMITYLNKNKKKLGNLASVIINFGPISLPLKSTVWKSK
tara:strand:- start:418 stop:606 length:189 start_codon:yes stop_codon:yes gene_type:complete